MKTPAPGTQFAGPNLKVPPGVVPFFEEAARRNVTWLSSMHCTRTNLTHVFVPTPDASIQAIRNGVSNDLSGNWSGYEQGHTAQYVQAGWTAPTAAKPPAGAYGNPGPDKYYSSAWSGIGGNPANQVPLIQSGTEHDITSGSVASYSFWYEVYGGTSDTGGAIYIDNQTLNISPGDDVANATFWDGSDQNNPYAEMGVCNFTINTCMNFDVPHTDAPGNSVESIGEAPSLGLQPLPLADFGAISFYNACWVQNFVRGGNNTCSAVGSIPTMFQLHQDVYGSSQIIASPGPITQDTETSSFTDVYIPPERGG